MEEYEDKYRVYYFDSKLNYKYEDVIASSKESAKNQVKDMKGLDVKMSGLKIINLTKTGLTDKRLEKHKKTLGKLY